MEILTDAQMKSLAERGGTAAANRYNQLAKKVSAGIASSSDKKQIVSLKENIDRLIGAVDQEIMTLTELKKSGGTISFKSPAVNDAVITIVPDKKNRDVREQEDHEEEIIFTVDEMLHIMRRPPDMRQEMLRSCYALCKELDGEMAL